MGYDFEATDAVNLPIYTGGCRGQPSREPPQQTYLWRIAQYGLRAAPVMTLRQPTQ